MHDRHRHHRGILRAPDLGSAPGGSGGDGARLPPDALAILPVREAVLFPGAVLPFAVNRQVSIAAVQHAIRDGQQIGVLMQRDPQVEEPGPGDLHRTGTVANILRMVTTPDGAHQLVCQGVQRFRVLDWVRERPFIAAGAYRIDEPDTRTPEVEARFLHLKRQAAEALHRDFPALAGGGIQVVLRGTGGDAPDPDTGQAFAAVVGQVTGVDRVDPTAAGGDVYVLTATPAGPGPLGPPARDAVQGIVQTEGHGRAPSGARPSSTARSGTRVRSLASA